MGRKEISQKSPGGPVLMEEVKLYGSGGRETGSSGVFWLFPVICFVDLVLTG